MRMSDWSSDVCSSDLCRLEQNLARLEDAWPDGAYVMRCLLSGQTRMRANGSLPSSLLPRIKACDQRSCELDRSVGGSKRNSCPVWTPGAWEDQSMRAIPLRSEEHTSELQSLMRISYAVLCLK